MQSSKRKRTEQEQEILQGVTVKTRRRLLQEDTADGRTINEVLPPELLSVIFQFAGEPTPQLIWMVGRKVCQLWKQILPSSSMYREQLHWDLAYDNSLLFLIAKNGWLSLLIWAYSEYPKRALAIKAAAAKYGHLKVLKKIGGSLFSMQLSYLFGKAAKGGHLESTQWLRSTFEGTLIYIVPSPVPLGKDMCR